jgi:ABC-type glycerol-3-phosphate transport system substrate-binding protein
MYWSISTDSKYAEESNKFIDWFINNKEVADVLGTSRGVPVSSKILEYLTPKFNEASKVGVDLLQRGSKDAPSIPFIPAGWTGFKSKDYNTVTDKLMFDKITPEKAYDELLQMANQYK